VHRRMPSDALVGNLIGGAIGGYIGYRLDLNPQRAIDSDPGASLRKRRVWYSHGPQDDAVDLAKISNRIYQDIRGGTTPRFTIASAYLPDGRVGITYNGIAARYLDDRVGLGNKSNREYIGRIRTVIDQHNSRNPSKRWVGLQDEFPGRYFDHAEKDMYDIFVDNYPTLPSAIGISNIEGMCDRCQRFFIGLNTYQPNIPNVLVKIPMAYYNPATASYELFQYP
jgi:hypothetical protein